MSSELQTDPLFLGLTRPTLLFGVSYNFAVLNAMVCMMGFIIGNDFSYLFLMVPIHLVGFFLTSKEPLFIELILNQNRLCPRCWNYTYHRGNSYDPS